MKWLIIFMFFLSVFLLFLSIFLKFTTTNRKRFEKRINHYLYKQKEEDNDVKKVRLHFNLEMAKRKIRKEVLTKSKNNKLEKWLYRAGVPLKPEEYVMFQWISIALGSGILYLIIDHVFIVPIGATIGYFIPRMIIEKKQRSRSKAFNENLPEMISSIVGALKAGFSFHQALISVCEEAKSPIKEELEMVLQEMKYGATQEQALNHLHDRMPSEDLNLMIQAIVIQRQVGGNLSSVLEKIVQTIRDRIHVQGQISTLTAQGRMSGMVVGLLPVALGVFIYFIRPDYIGKLFTHPLGIAMVVAAVISSSIGFMLIRKITTIEV